MQFIASQKLSIGIDFGLEIKYIYGINVPPVYLDLAGFH